jgi:hypothetical protein
LAHIVFFSWLLDDGVVRRGRGKRVARLLEDLLRAYKVHPILNALGLFDIN